jgi:UDP-GlcNAc:undecaprenyl-phosphate GlcNAc-1-phosphate transferase
MEVINTSFSAAQILLPAISVVICALFILTTRSQAFKFGLVDQPKSSSHKMHSRPTPYTGGLAIYTSMLLLLFVYDLYSFWPLVVIAGGGLVLLGVVDDSQDITPTIRFIAQVVVVYAFVQISDTRIETLGFIFGTEETVLGDITGTIFTVLCVIGVINAINMIDGLDGLSGAMLIISLAGVAMLALIAGDSSGSLLFVCTLAACIGAFLLFNTGVFGENHKVFLGDSGSTVLGFFLAWILIEGSQAELAYISTVSAGWIFGLPLIDTVSLIVRRSMEGRSPVASGRDHLHHRLLDVGFNRVETLLIMIALHFSLVAVGTISNLVNVSDMIMFYGFVGLVVLYHSIAAYSGRIQKSSIFTRKHGRSTEAVKYDL